MTDSEKLLVKFADKKIKLRHHDVYIVQGVRFSLHRGNKPNPQEIYKVKKQLRKLGLIK